MNQSQPTPTKQQSSTEQLIAEIKQTPEVKFLGISDEQPIVAFKGRPPTLRQGNVGSDLPLDMQQKAMEYFRQKSHHTIDVTEWTIGSATSYQNSNYKY